jgi:hypothetical protein
MPFDQPTIAISVNFEESASLRPFCVTLDWSLRLTVSILDVIQWHRSPLLIGDMKLISAPELWIICRYYCLHSASSSDMADT